MNSFNQITLSTTKKIHEGQNLIINGEITNPTIKNIYYKFSDYTSDTWITSSDLVSDSLSGSTVIDNNGKFNITETIRLDLKTEYTEHLYIDFYLDKDLKQPIKNELTSIEVYDSSKSPTYIEDKTIIEEGENINIKIKSDLISAGSTIFWTIKGVDNKSTFSREDLLHQSDFGEIKITNNEFTSIKIPTVRDLDWEHSEYAKIYIYSDKKKES